MAGSIVTVDAVAALTADQTNEVEGSGGHHAATFLVDVTAITRTTGTLEVSLYWSPDGTVAGGILVAQVTGLTATGLAEVVPQAPFESANRAIPAPNVVLWDLVGDTTGVSGDIYAIYD